MKKPTPKLKRSTDPLRLDPSRTGALRHQFAAEITREFNKLKVDVYRLVSRADAFGLREPEPVTWNSEQPRDDHGKWTSGGHSLTHEVLDRINRTSELSDRFHAASKLTRGRSDAKEEAGASAAGFKAPSDYYKHQFDTLNHPTVHHVSEVLAEGFFGTDYGKGVYESLASGKLSDTAKLVKNLSTRQLPTPTTLTRIDSRVSSGLKEGDRFNFDTPAAFTTHASPGVFTGVKVVVHGAVYGTKVSSLSQYASEGEVFSYHPHGYEVNKVTEENGYKTYHVKPVMRPTMNSQARVPAGSPNGGEFASTEHTPGSDALTRHTLELSGLHDRFPVLKSLPAVSVHVIPGDSFTPVGVGLAIHGVPIYGSYSHRENKITMAEGLAKSSQPVLGGYTVGGDSSTGLRHEYGHHVQDHIGVPTDPDSGRRLSWQNLSREFVGPDKVTMVSEYAKMTHKELFAESFAVYTHDGYIRGSLPQPIEHYFDVALRSRKPTTNTAWASNNDPGKIQQFKDWLRSKVANWFPNVWDQFISAAYRKGAVRAFEDQRRSDPKLRDATPDYQSGATAGMLSVAFGGPTSQDRLDVLLGRSWDEMENVTADMGVRLTRALADGLTSGESPRKIATDMTRSIEFSKNRALTVARTECVRAHAEGQLTSLEKMGVEEIGVSVEWLPAAGACPKCSAMAGKTFTLAEARGKIPAHPNCRCCFTPAGAILYSDGKVPKGKGFAPPRRIAKKPLKKPGKASAAPTSSSGKKPAGRGFAPTTNGGRVSYDFDFLVRYQERS